MADFIIITAVTLIVVINIYRYIKRRKSGQKCAGCPYAANCSSQCNVKPKNSDLLKKSK